VCGVAGIVSQDPGLLDRLGDMIRSIRHRGPDDEGRLVAPPVALGHRRLSIIDLESGRQPLSNEDGTVHIVYNGEIYNFPQLRRELEGQGVTFRTRSDTEVVLRLYERDGARCVERLRGMFAFGIWDARARRLVLARDRIGQKPMFWAATPRGFAFGSEVKAVLASGLVEPGVDLEALWHYVSLRFIPDEMTLFRGVRKLPAAHVLIYEEGRARLERYWEISYRDKLRGGEAEVAEELDGVLTESVRAHTLADVPVGAFLSGGIDSSLMTALLATGSPQAVPTFSIGVEEQDWNELPWARQVAEAYRTDHHEWVVRADLVRLLPRMIWHMDEPADPFGAGVFLVSERAARSVKVVLTGDGGDELFAGYDRFAGQQLVELYCLLPEFLRRTVMHRIAGAIPDSYGYKSFAQKVRWLNDLSLTNRGDRYARSLSFLRFTEEAKARLFSDAARARIGPPDSREKVLRYFNAEGVDDLVDRMLHTDCMTRLPDHLLLIVDRMAMAHGLEARPPMLDHHVIEFAARIPGRMKLKGRKLKHILKTVAARHLPAPLINRPKQGFGFPLAAWMRGELRGLMEGMVADSRMAESGIFDRAEMSRLVSEHVSGAADNNFRLWILLNLEIWHRIFLEGWSPDQALEWLERTGGQGHASRHAHAGR